jgi:tetratricopeptide (TPR) repeat protein
MVRRITRKKKVTDEQEELLGVTHRLWLGITEKPKQTAMIAGGAAGAILIVLLAFYLRDRARVESIRDLAGTVALYQQEEGPGRDSGAVMEDLEELAARHSGSDMGGQALNNHAGILAEKGEYQRAIETYGKVRAEYSSNEHLADAAAVALAYTHRLAGEDEKSLQLFRELSEKKGSLLPLAQIQLEIGLVNDSLGRGQEAAEAYRAVIDAYPDSAWSSQAQELLVAIEGA